LTIQPDLAYNFFERLTGKTAALRESGNINVSRIGV